MPHTYIRFYTVRERYAGILSTSIQHYAIAVTAWVKFPTQTNDRKFG